MGVADKIRREGILRLPILVMAERSRRKRKRTCQTIHSKINTIKHIKPS